MKYTKVFCFFISMLVILSVLCACRAEVDTTEPVTENTSVQSASDTHTSEAENATAEQKETQDVSFATEAGELEIITIPQEEVKEDKSEAISEPTSPQKQSEPQTENVPNESRIELPFVPAN